jgi:hypothetical protein
MTNTTNTAPVCPTWLRNHAIAMSHPRPGFESAIVGMLNAWAAYEQAHTKNHEHTIGDDHVLGPAWESLGQAIRALLNGETGRLDCGTIDGIICSRLKANGFTI